MPSLFRIAHTLFPLWRVSGLRSGNRTLNKFGANGRAIVIDVIIAGDQEIFRIGMAEALAY
jgi:hypothetical protein